ncbi:hypothetical protein DV736_g5102, partial [Chaetothyriales sp. CBS 134916]
MSLPIEPSPNGDIRTYPNGLPIINTLHTDQLHWLAATSSLAGPSWFPESYRPDKASTSSSGSAGFPMDTVNSQQSSYNSQSLDELAINKPPAEASLPHLHLSGLENSSTWTSTWPHSSNPESYHTPSIGSTPLTHPKAYTTPINPESPYSTTSLFGESPVRSSYYSSPDLANAGFANLSPRSLLQEDLDYEDDEDGQGGKPYARLIYEALLEAPGHRMMLRDIYDWFEKNTTKPRESGTNGWQNSIRHNLSMNHAFENDKTQTVNARGEPKKATSVWYLTDYALRNGVQSTTRYRKNGGTRRSALHGRPNAVRARSGAKGGRAARRAARFRQKEQSPYPAWAFPVQIDDMGPFNHLVKFSPEIGNPLKADTADVTFNEFKSQDLFLSEHLDGTLDDSWFQASHIG